MTQAALIIVRVYIMMDGVATIFCINLNLATRVSVSCTVQKDSLVTTFSAQIELKAIGEISDGNQTFNVVTIIKI
jgi:hypothetical protein